jgi:L,D-peptidoglycan transpeptidase YkuD (ErfK/YbiS/YcfS/YnhG family)
MDLLLYVSSEGAMLDWGDGPRRCAIGPAGIAVKSREGDGITPRGDFPLRQIFYRADRVPNPKSILPVRATEPSDGWCDAPADPHYNQLVKLPYPASAENLWRDDSLYDLVAVVGFNDDPVVPGKGSAIFLHLAKPDYLPTAGCVALSQADLRAGLAQLRLGDKIRIV